MTNDELKDKYPSIEFAFPLAVASYDIALKRLDAMDSRLQTVIAFIVATSAVVPSVGAGRIHFRSGWFYAAVFIFVVAISLGTYARLKGRIKVFTPRDVFNHWLHKPEWEFKKDFIAVAADDFDENNKLVFFRWKFAVLLTILFLFQAACLGLWVRDSF